MSKQFNDIESAKAYLEKLQNKINEYNDLEYNLNEQLAKQNADIKALKNLQSDLKHSNYELWQNQNVMNTEISEIEEHEVTIDDIVGGIL